ncbi:MAG: molybdopterin-dependent oxidoreductase, partial [Phycisphaerae bacterium]|nr:molybdopterin-dependent oxidoreductase [Phycisphaerae bacterium]
MPRPPGPRRFAPPSAGGGWPAIWYTLKSARRAGGIARMVRALTARNACKTCALGMGGQSGGMTSESGRFPEVCKKSVQAMAADMQGRIRPGFFDTFDLNALARLSPRELELSGRLTEPLFAAAGDSRYRPISWDDALDIAGQALRDAPPEDTFYYASGRSSNEAGFLLQLVARLRGTNNVNNCSFFCHQASGVGLKAVIGSGAGTITLDDLDHADLVFLIGANPASNHPRLMRSLVDLRRRGGAVVVVNPLREIGLVNFRVPSDPLSLLLGSRIADEYLQPHIGGDAALISAIAKAVLEAAAHEPAFLDACTEGAADWLSSLRDLAWPDLVERSGVPEPDIRRVAHLYARSRNAVFCWTMGITHHAHGVDNVLAIANLALLRGMVGKPGAGLLPLRGHSNVQGIGTVGVIPTPTPAMLKAMESHFGVPLPSAAGLDTLACVRRAAEGRVRAALHLGGNLFGSCPDAPWAEASLRKIDLTVFLSTTLNTGHARGRGQASLILPVLARDEDPQATTQESMFSFVRYSEGGRPRHEGPRPEVAVIAAIARRALEGTPAARAIDLTALEHHANLRKAIAAVVPELDRLATIDASKVEFAIPGRAFHQPRFSTPSGKARVHPIALPPARTPGELRLATIRSEGQFNT